MNQIRQYFAGVVLLGGVLLFADCNGPSNPSNPSNPSGDATPPGFVQVLVRLEVPNDPNSRGDFDITTQDVSKDNISPNYVIRIQATAGDSESGITGIELETRQVFDKSSNSNKPSNLTWKCVFGPSPGSVLVHLLQPGLLPFKFNPLPSPPPLLWQVNAVADPIAATGCTIDKPNGVGPINVEGFVRLKVTNGTGLTAISKTFIFNYIDVGIGK